MTNKTLKTVKDLKDFLNQFDDDKEVLFLGKDSWQKWKSGVFTEAIL